MRIAIERWSRVAKIRTARNVPNQVAMQTPIEIGWSNEANDKKSATNAVTHSRD